MMTVDKRKELFAELGYEYSEEGIKKLQSDYMSRKSDVDGVYGPDTENCLLTVYYTKKYTKNFDAKEFKCECGRYCCGYPDYMKPVELNAIQKVRDHYGKPITVTSGLRCSRYNASLSGSVSNSPHKTGNAIDFYQQGVTDTYNHRMSTIEFMRTLPGFNYAYGNGGDSSGNKFSASCMGNAMHMDCKGDAIPAQTTPASSSTKKETKITVLRVDGIAGHDTITITQKYFGTVQDGVLSGQVTSLKRYFPAITAVTYGKGGSNCVRKIQAWCGATVDGTLGKETITKWQRKLANLGYYTGAIDGIFGAISASAWQNFLNKQVFGIEPEKPAKKDYTLVVDVSEFQSAIDWAKVKASGIDGAIIRCGLRYAESAKLAEDEMFKNHITGAHKAGLKVGIYMFTEAVNAAEGKEEAQYAINLWKKTGIPLSYPIAIDSENVNWKNGGKGRANSGVLSKAKRTEAIKAFGEEVNRQGYKCMLYASTSWLNNQVDMSVLSPIMDVWCAQYYTTCEYKGKYILWQYTSSGSVNGIKGNVDINKCYI